MIETPKEYNMHFMSVAKSGAHKYMYEWLDAYKERHCAEFTDKEGITHQYRWQNGVPLHGGAKAIEVNYFEYQKFENGVKVGDMQSWVTDIEITQKNVEQ